MNGWVVLLWSFVAALVLVIVGIFGALVFMGRIPLFPDAGARPAPEETGIVDTSYSVMLLNATPEEGLDARLREELVAAGWPDASVYASDSASGDFAATTVYYIDPQDEQAAIGLSRVLGGAEVQQNDFYAALNETDQRQLTAVIGLDRSAAATEEPQ